MLSNTKLTQVILSILLTMNFISSPLAAGVGINATRVVFMEGSVSAPVVIRNNHLDEAYLVQAYLTNEQQQNTSIPFEVLPPMFRLGPESRNEVRIVAKANTLPKDRESIFYFHARAIPANSTNIESKQNGGVIKIALENVIKVFYRPKNLALSPKQAQSGLVFEPVSGGLKVKNPSPYYISLTRIAVDNQLVQLSLDKNNTMIAPFSELFYPTTKNRGNVSWTTINDLGGYDAHSQKI